MRTSESMHAQEHPIYRLHTAGAAALSTRELLAITTDSYNDYGAAAGEVLKKANGSLRELARLSYREIAVKGVGRGRAAKITAALELGRRMAREASYERERIQGPVDVYEMLAPRLRDATQEHVIALLLNTQNGLLREVTITIGTLDCSVLHPREVFRPAIAESAASIILAHNHPSGDPAPSREDRDITEQIAAAGRVIGIPLTDHVIIGDGRYTSMVEMGLLDGAV